MAHKAPLSLSDCASPRMNPRHLNDISSPHDIELPGLSEDGNDLVYEIDEHLPFGNKDEVYAAASHSGPPSLSLESPQSSYGLRDHSFYESMQRIDDFGSVEEKGGESDVPRLLPSSPALETFQSLYRMENYDSLYSFNEMREREAWEST